MQGSSADVENFKPFDRNDSFHTGRVILSLDG